MSLTGCTRYGPYGQEEYKTSYYSELFIPSSVLRVDPTEHEIAWASALCCVYVRIVEWTEEDMVQYGVNPLAQPHRVEFYDGSSKQYDDNAFVRIAEQVYKDICAMDIGSLDCARETSCTDNALILYSMDTTGEMTVRANVAPLRANVAPVQPETTNVSVRPDRRDPNEERTKTEDWGAALGAAIAAALVLVACLVITCRLLARTARKLKRAGLCPMSQRRGAASSRTKNKTIVEIAPSPTAVLDG